MALITRLRADGMLLLAAMIWGGGFVAMKIGSTYMQPVLFIGIRFLMAAMAIFPITIREIDSEPPLKFRDYKYALLISFALFVASTLQQMGLTLTTATNTGFLTSLYILLVPFVSRMLSRTRIRPIVMAACVISLIGAWLLSGFGSIMSFSLGDVIVVAADIVWAFHIVLIERYAKKAERPFFLSFMQYIVAGGLGLALGLATETFTWASVAWALPTLLYASLLSAGVGFTLQIIGQRHTPATEASLIMALEGVFGAIGGALVLHEKLTMSGLAGCGLILTGILLAEVGPLLQRRKQNSW